MSTIPISQVVQVNPGVISAGGAASRLTGLVVSQDTSVAPGQLLDFYTATDVSDWFGPSAPETVVANNYFPGIVNGGQLPYDLKFARYVAAAAPAGVYGAQLKTLTLTELQGFSGTLIVTTSALFTSTTIDLSTAASFADAATLMTAGFTTPDFAITWDTQRERFLLLTTATGIPSGIEPWNTTIKMDIFGAKVRVFGEAIYDSDNLIPQVAVGGFYKINHNKALLQTLQAAKSKDWEAYISATKIFFPINTLINVTLRYAAANETGLTGFGGPDGDKKKIRPEVSLAYLLNKRTAIGAEYQKHGDNLDGKGVSLQGINTGALSPVLGAVLPNLNASLTQHESDWYDAFVAFFPSKHLSITMAYAMLGNITLTPNQNGYYVSLQASF